MGYVGFGINKWAYKQLPRKPFSKHKKRVGDIDMRKDGTDIHDIYRKETTKFCKYSKLSSYNTLKPYPIKYILKRLGILIGIVVLAIIMVIVFLK